jgi:hypothetical protein
MLFLTYKSLYTCLFSKHSTHIPLSLPNYNGTCEFWLHTTRDFQVVCSQPHYQLFCVRGVLLSKLLAHIDYVSGMGDALPYFTCPSFRELYVEMEDVFRQTVLSYLTTHTPKETSKHYGIHISMVYKWNYSKDKINQAGKKAVKPGAGMKPMHPEIEQLS